MLLFLPFSGLGIYERILKFGVLTSNSATLRVTGLQE